MADQFKSLLIQWNNTFPLDRWYRDKYKIPFNSEAHKNTDQIDIYLEWREDQLFQEFEQEQIRAKENQEEREKGHWLRERKLTEEQKLDLFNKIDLKKFNFKSNNLKIE